ncbi:MAG: phosphatidate cytidylyltransferase [Acidobacteriota bacterium]
MKLPDDRLLMALGAIVGLLVLASLIVFALKKAKPQGNFDELSSRIKSWWIMVGVFSLAVAVHRTVTFVFFALLSFLALREYLSLVPTRSEDHRPHLWLFAAIPIQYWWVATGWYGMFIIFVPVYVFLFLPARMVLIGKTEDYLRAIGTLHWGAMITIFGVSHAAYLLALPGAADNPADGPGLLLFLVALTQLNDVAQFCWGKTLGRTKAAPTVSPGKTLEGLLGGVGTTILLSWLVAPWLTPLTPLQSVLAGLIIGLGGFLGDLNISAIKRDLQVKDSSQLIPGHGGLLDRIDSLSYTAPLFLHFIRYLHG